jgi:hypothetical protein
MLPLKRYGSQANAESPDQETPALRLSNMNVALGEPRLLQFKLRHRRRNLALEAFNTNGPNGRALGNATMHVETSATSAHAFHELRHNQCLFDLSDTLPIPQGLPPQNALACCMLPPWR